MVSSKKEQEDSGKDDATIQVLPHHGGGFLMEGPMWQYPEEEIIFFFEQDEGENQQKDESLPPLSPPVLHRVKLDRVPPVISPVLLSATIPSVNKENIFTNSNPTMRTRMRNSRNISDYIDTRLVGSIEDTAKNRKKRRMLHYFPEAAKNVKAEYVSDLATFYIRRPYGIIASGKQKQHDIIFDSSSRKGARSAEIYSKRSCASSSQTIDVAAMIKVDGSLLILEGKSDILYKINPKSYSWSSNNNNKNNDNNKNNTKCGDDDWNAVPNSSDLDTPLGYVTYLTDYGQKFIYSLDEIAEQASLIREQYCSSISNIAFDLEQHTYQKSITTTASASSTSTCSCPSSSSSSNSQSPPSLEISISSHYLGEEVMDSSNTSMFEYLLSQISSSQVHPSDESSPPSLPSSRTNHSRQDLQKWRQWLYNKLQLYRFYIIRLFLVFMVILGIKLETSYRCNDIQKVSSATSFAEKSMYDDDSMKIITDWSKLIVGYNSDFTTDSIALDGSTQRLSVEKQQSKEHSRLRLAVESLTVNLKSKEAERYKLESAIQGLRNELLSVRRDHEINDYWQNNSTNCVYGTHRTEETSHQTNKIQFAHLNKTFVNARSLHQDLEKGGLTTEGTSTSSLIKMQSMQNALLNGLTSKGPILPKVFRRVSNRVSLFLEANNSIIGSAGIFTKGMERLGTNFQANKSVDDVSLNCIKKLDHTNESLRALGLFALKSVESMRERVNVSSRKRNKKKQRGAPAIKRDNVYHAVISKALVSFRNKLKNRKTIMIKQKDITNQS